MAKEDMRKIPPPTRPKAAICGFCEVRQLCGEYWTIAVQARLLQETGVSIARCDLEVGVLDQVGPHTWNAHVICSSSFEAGTKLIIMSRQPQYEVLFSRGTVLRIVDASVDSNHEDGSGTVATVTGATEIFLVPEREG
jgi:hypothetical protein